MDYSIFSDEIPDGWNKIFEVSSVDSDSVKEVYDAIKTHIENTKEDRRNPYNLAVKIHIDPSLSVYMNPEEVSEIGKLLDKVEIIELGNKPEKERNEILRSAKKIDMLQERKHHKKVRLIKVSGLDPEEILKLCFSFNPEAPYGYFNSLYDITGTLKAFGKDKLEWSIVEPAIRNLLYRASFSQITIAKMFD